MTSHCRPSGSGTAGTSATATSGTASSCRPTSRSAIRICATSTSPRGTPSRDLETWEHLGTTFAPAEAPAWDDYTTWTGSVVQGDDGLWHLFYTGTRRSEDGLKQRIGHATSTDLHTWQRVGRRARLDLSGDLYEEYAPGHWHDRAMRDPWVMRDPQGGWLMYFTAPHARRRGAERRRRDRLRHLAGPL